jgi:hypothetical protein
MCCGRQVAEADEDVDLRETCLQCLDSFVLKSNVAVKPYLPKCIETGAHVTVGLCWFGGWSHMCRLGITNVHGRARKHWRVGFVVAIAKPVKKYMPFSGSRDTCARCKDDQFIIAMHCITICRLLIDPVLIHLQENCF